MVSTFGDGFISAGYVSTYVIVLIVPLDPARSTSHYVTFCKTDPSLTLVPFSCGPQSLQKQSSGISV